MQKTLIKKQKKKRDDRDNKHSDVVSNKTYSIFETKELKSLALSFAFRLSAINTNC